MVCTLRTPFCFDVAFFFFFRHQVIASLGDYLTANGGRVNLKQVDVIMSEVGEIEDEVFKRRKQADVKEQVLSATVTTAFLLLLLLLRMWILGWFNQRFVTADTCSPLSRRRQGESPVSSCKMRDSRLPVSASSLTARCCTPCMPILAPSSLSAWCHHMLRVS